MRSISARRRVPAYHRPVMRISRRSSVVHRSGSSRACGAGWARLRRVWASSRCGSAPLERESRGYTCGSTIGRSTMATTHIDVPPARQLRPVAPDLTAKHGRKIYKEAPRVRPRGLFTLAGPPHPRASRQSVLHLLPRLLGVARAEAKCGPGRGDARADVTRGRAVSRRLERARAP